MFTSGGEKSGSLTRDSRTSDQSGPLLPSISQPSPHGVLPGSSSPPPVDSAPAPEGRLLQGTDVMLLVLSHLHSVSTLLYIAIFHQTWPFVS